MRPRGVAGCAAIFSVLAAVMSVAAQEVSGVEHWVEHAGLKLYVWEKYLGSPAGKPVVVLAHGSTSAGRESFDLQVPGNKPRQRILYAGAEINRLYPGCSISMSNHAV
jgi:hypothetical protein